ncbi:alcohol dehydrogenase catalytic domain-containing protein [Lentzea alba]|uniref:alcohol dehydrogenase catalytic domain-containing protein n=1 Tax=Lentzea alba TaxID=2714351 RepID=UPI0039BFF10C
MHLICPADRKNAVLKTIRCTRPLEQPFTDPELVHSGVLLGVLVTGVCGAGVNRHTGELGPMYRLAPKHEMVGEVVALGEGATRFATVQLVAVDNVVPCRGCACRRRAQPGLSENPEAFVVTTPDGFAEPFSCAIHGLDLLRAQTDSGVPIVGDETRRPARHATAARRRRAGDGHVLDAVKARRRGGTAEPGAGRAGRDDRRDRVPVGDVARARLAARGLHFADLRNGGGTAPLSVNPYDFLHGELTVNAPFTRSFGFDRAMRMLRTERIRPDGLVTHRFGLAQHDDRASLKRVIAP